MVLTIFSTPPPTSFLYLTSAMSGSTPVVSQSIMNAIVPVGREHRDLRVAHAVLARQVERLVPALARRREQVERHERGVQLVRVGAVLVDHPQLRLAVRGVALVRPERRREARRLPVGLAAHERGDGGRVLAAGVRVVRQAERHEERAQVGVAEAELAVRVRVRP